MEGKTHIKDQEKKILYNYEKNIDLHDIWRILNPNTRKYTWHSNTKPPILCRLDYFLISEHIINIVTTSNITTGFKSDHSIVSFGLQTETNKRGPGYFKLNNSLLLSTDYQQQIRQNINIVSEINKNANPNTLWEIIKGTIRNVTIKYASTEKEKKILTWRKR